MHEKEEEIEFEMRNSVLYMFPNYISKIVTQKEQVICM